MYESNWRGFSQQTEAIPIVDQLLYHRLVSGENICLPFSIFHPILSFFRSRFLPYVLSYVPYGFEHSALEPGNTSHGVTREHAKEHAGFLFVF